MKPSANNQKFIILNSRYHNFFFQFIDRAMLTIYKVKGGSLANEPPLSAVILLNRFC